MLFIRFQLMFFFSKVWFFFLFLFFLFSFVGKRVAQEQAVTAIAAIADCAEDIFRKYYANFVPFLFQILTAQTGKEYRVRIGWWIIYLFNFFILFLSSLFILLLLFLIYLFYFYLVYLFYYYYF